MKRLKLLSLLLAITLFVINSIIITLQKPKLNIRNYAVYYGTDQKELLAKFDLVILSPLISDNVISYLKSRRVKVIGYVSISTLGGWEPWSKYVSKNIIIMRRELWNEYVINVCSPSWEKIILEKVIPYLVKKGFDGVFFDNLDMVTVYPQFSKAIIKIIKDVRQRYNNIIIIVNRGFTITNKIAPYINGVLYEDFGTYYNFTTKKYVKVKDLTFLQITSKYLRKLAEEYNLTILALGYADVSNKTQLKEYMTYVNNLAKKYGFIPYVTDIYLSKINTLYAIEENKLIISESLTFKGLLTRVMIVLTVALIILVVILLLLCKSRRANIFKGK